MGLFNLIFNLGVNQADFRRGMKESVDHVGRSAKEMGHHLGEHGPIGGAIHQVQHMIMGMIGLHAFTHAVHGTIEYAAKIYDVGEALGVSTDKVQELDYALKQNGATMEDGVKAMRKLAVARAAALEDPKGKQAMAFQKFGIGPEALAATESPAELFVMLSDAIKGTEMDLNSLPPLLDLIGARQTAVIPAMVAGLRDAGEAAASFGLIMDSENVEALHAAEQATDRLSKAFSVGLAPAIAEVSKWLLAFIDGIQVLGGGLGAMWDAVEKKGIGISKADLASAFDSGSVETVKGIDRERAKEADDHKRHKLDFEELGEHGLAKREARAEKEAEKALEKQLHLEEQIHNSKLQQMKPAERLKQIEQDRSDYAVKAFEAAGEGNDISLEDAAKLAKMDEQIASLSGGKAGAVKNLNKSDSLTAVGNFLGGGADPALQKLGVIHDTLKGIQASTEKTANGTLTIPRV